MCCPSIYNMSQKFWMKMTQTKKAEKSLEFWPRAGAGHVGRRKISRTFVSLRVAPKLGRKASAHNVAHTAKIGCWSIFTCFLLCFHSLNLDLNLNHFLGLLLRLKSLKLLVLSPNSFFSPGIRPTQQNTRYECKLIIY